MLTNYNGIPRGSHKNNLPFQVFLVLVVTCCPSPASAEQAKDVTIQAIPLCTVIANAAKYNGKEILVRGLYRILIHDVILMDRECSKIDVTLRNSPQYRADKMAMGVLRSITKRDRFQPVDVVFRGVFRVAHEGQCFGEICAGFEIETTELVSARPEASRKADSK